MLSFFPKSLCVVREGFAKGKDEALQTGFN